MEAYDIRQAAVRFPVHMRLPGGSMAAHSTPSHSSSRHELRFHPLDNSRPVFSFRCDACGEVDLDQLSNRDRNNYLYARVSIGREFARPSVEVCDPV
jgi:hypothetical protein